MTYDKKTWEKFLLSEALSEYEVGGKVKLYHYSRLESDSVLLDPERFKTSRGSWSKREYQRSSFPRTFFYLDKEKTETMIASGEPFVAEVNRDDIYDLMMDEEDLLTKSKKASGLVVPDYSKVFKSLTGKDKPTPGYEEYFKPIRDDGAKLYKGVYYTIYGEPAIPVVAWFEEIQANKERNQDEEG